MHENDLYSLVRTETHKDGRTEKVVRLFHDKQKAIDAGCKEAKEFADMAERMRLHAYDSFSTWPHWDHMVGVKKSKKASKYDYSFLWEVIDAYICD